MRTLFNYFDSIQALSDSLKLVDFNVSMKEVKEFAFYYGLHFVYADIDLVESVIATMSNESCHASGHQTLLIVAQEVKI